MAFNWVRFTNWTLLIATVALGITGTLGLFWTAYPWLFDLHRFAGWLLIVTLPAKAIIVIRSLKRGFGAKTYQGLIKSVSIVLAALTLLVIALGVVWMWQLAPDLAWLRQTVISWHWMIGLGLLAPFLLHVWKRWQKPKSVDFRSRRGAVRLIGTGLFTIAAWRLSERIISNKPLLSSIRRFTGSREQGSYQGNDFPVTNNAGEGRLPIDPKAWHLDVETLDRAVSQYSYDDLSKMENAEVTATIDCTLGWFSTQVWSGIPITRILALPPQNLDHRLGVRIESVSGYAHTFPLNEANQILLATHVGGQPLDHWHGFPLRAVVPHRRGWFWVKWVTKIQLVPL